MESLAQARAAALAQRESFPKVARLVCDLSPAELMTQIFRDIRYTILPGVGIFWYMESCSYTRRAVGIMVAILVYNI